MPLLQDPLKALHQIEWFLDNTHHEKFPGAFELAAGNLCRQTLEQILFILCFYGQVRRRGYLRPNKSLHVASRLIAELDATEMSTRRTHWELARQAGPRIRKFARWPTTLKRWRRQLNEPSHFATRFRGVDEPWMRSFVARAGALLDDKDKYLITAALNELFSGSRFRAYLGSDPDNTPGVEVTIVVTPGQLRKSPNGGVTVEAAVPIMVIPKAKIPRGRWPRGGVVLLEHTADMTIRSRVVNREGEPVNLQTLQDVIAAFGKTEHQRRFLVSHFARLGLKLSFKGPAA